MALWISPAGNGRDGDGSASLTTGLETISYFREVIMKHITLTGNLGSGKSTICKLLEGNYGYEIYSTGKVQRSLAEELGISVLEMNQKMCEDHSFDKMIDDTTARISRENPEKKIVFDSRLAWNFVERSFKVFLSVSLTVAAERVYQDNRGNVERYISKEDAKEQLKLRAETENQRYREIYGLEYFDFSNYDLILDSTFGSPELLAQVLITEAENAEQKQQTELLLSPQRLGIEVQQIQETGTCYAPDSFIKVKNSGDNFFIVEGQEAAEQAAKKGYPLLRARLVR